MWEMSTAIWWWFYSGLSVLNQSSYQCICLENNHFHGVFVWFNKKKLTPQDSVLHFYPNFDHVYSQKNFSA